MATEICPVCEKTDLTISNPQDDSYKLKVCMECYLALEAERILVWKKKTANAETTNQK